MELTLTPFKADDGLEILGRDAERYIDLLIKMEMDGPGWTGRLPDNRILACAGMMQVAPWVADFWVLPTMWVPFYPLLFHKTVMRKFQKLMAASSCRRFQAIVDPSYAERVRWVTRLGFVREGTMRAFGPDGQDMDLYALVRETPDDGH